MSNQILYIIMGVSVVAMAIIGIIYYILSKKMQKSEYKRIQKLQQGTKAEGLSAEVIYQKLYLTYRKIPFLKICIKIKKKIRNIKYR